MNDDSAQAYLASIYDKGTKTISKDIRKALYYYQLSADNGNAESQARLAQLYMTLDKDREGRAALHDYLNSVIPVDIVNSFNGKNAKKTDFERFDGSLMHPYVLLVLANEKPENKWYYTTEVKKAPAYSKELLKSFKLDPEKQKALMRQASVWKKRKLLEIARQILSDSEYKTFVTTLYPTKGQADSFQRNQLLKEFQEKVKQRKQQDQESAQAFY
jgi:TPR repeat protein